MTFVNLLLLLGTAAAAAPLLIHLLHRGKYRIVDWGAMHLLEAVIQENHRRIRFREWLLLLIRCAIPIALAFCLARPLLVKGGLGGGAASRQTIVALDDTYSMNDRHQNDASPWQRSLDHVNQLIEAGSPDRNRVFLLGGTPIEVNSTDSFASTLNQVRPQAATLDPFSSLAKMIGAAKQRPAEQHEIIVISDFQASDWNALSEDQWQALRQSLEELTLPPSITLLPLQPNISTSADIPSASPNLSIRSVDWIPLRWTPGQSVELTSVVANDGPSQQSASIEISVGDQILERRTINVPAKGTSQVVAQYTVPSPFGTPENNSTIGEEPAAASTSSNSAAPESDDEPQQRSIPIRVRIQSDDAISTDNQFDAVAVIAPPLSVAIVGGSATVNGTNQLASGNAPLPSISSADFLLAALSPFTFANRANLNSDGNSASPPPVQDAIRATKLELTAIDLTRLADIDVLVLIEPTGIPAVQLTAIENYVKQGGALLVFAGPAMTANSTWINDHFWQAGNGWLPRPMAAPEQPNEPSNAATGRARRIVGTRFEHPAMTIFNDELADVLNDVFVTQTIALDLADDSQNLMSRTILSLDDGTPLGLELPLGTALGAETSGPVIFITTTVDPRWTNFPLRPAFIPFVQGIVEYLAGNSQDHYNGLSGEPASIPLTQRNSNRLEVLTPSGDKLTTVSSSSSTTSQITWNETREVGIYQVEEESKPVEYYAVNLSPIESARDSISLENVRLLAEQLGANVALDIEEYQSQQRERQFGREVWRWVWWLVLFLLVIERGVVWSLGRIA